MSHMWYTCDLVSSACAILWVTWHTHSRPNGLCHESFTAHVWLCLVRLWDSLTQESHDIRIQDQMVCVTRYSRHICHLVASPWFLASYHVYISLTQAIPQADETKSHMCHIWLIKQSTWRYVYDCHTWHMCDLVSSDAQDKFTKTLCIQLWYHLSCHTTSLFVFQIIHTTSNQLWG